MNTFIFHALPTLFSLFVKGTVLLLAAWTACLLLRRSSAATRHLVWAAALVAVVVLPILSLSLPRWNVAVVHHAAVLPTAPPLAATTIPSADVPFGGADKTPALSPAPSSEQTTQRNELNSAATVPPPPEIKRSYSTLVVCTAVTIIAWLIGFILIVVQFFVGLRQIERIRKQALPLDGAVLGIAQDVQRRFDIRRVTFLRASDKLGVAVPVTWGLFRPTVLLPEQSVFWSEPCLQAALLHELAHVQRWDWATQVTARLACALYWWHPLLWFSAKQARAESERACDDLVLGTGVKATDYAQRLVEVVRSMPAGGQSRSVAIAMAQPSEVEGRLRAVLAKGCSRCPLTRRRTISSFVVVLILALPLAALRLTPSAQAKSSVPANTMADVHATSERVTVADGHIAIVDGDRALFPGGYEVSLVAVTQAVRTGDEWDMFGGPWWRPDGTPIAPQSDGTNGHWHWTVARTHRLAPFVFKVAFRAPRSTWRRGESYAPGFFEQFPGSLRPNDRAVEGMPTPLFDGSVPQRFGGAVGSTRCAELYPTGTRVCTVRFGVAVGPWRTAATHPFALTPASVTPDLSQSARYQTDVSLTLDEHPRETYLDAQGKPHVFYFLGGATILPNVARRFVAVDTAGHAVPLSEFGKQKVALAFGHSDVTKWNPHVDLSKIKEFRLQTCPYKTVEFRNIQLQPAAETGGLVPSSATLLAQAGAHQLEQARQLRAHLRPWAQNNKALLQKMAQAQPSNLTALMQVYTSLQHLPFPLWSGDPRMGQGSEDAPFANDLPSHLMLTHLQRSQDFTETRVKRDFLQLHDLAMAQSVNAGRSHVTVWASGRITQTTETDKFMGHGQPIGMVESQQEIVAPFFNSGSTGGVAVSPPQAASSRSSGLPMLPQGQNNPVPHIALPSNSASMHVVGDAGKQRPKTDKSQAQAAAKPNQAAAGSNFDKGAQAAISAAYAGMDKALIAHNIAAYMNHLHPDFVGIYPQGKQIHGKAEDTASLSQLFAVVTTVTSSTQMLSLTLQDGGAVVTARESFSMSGKGEDMPITLSSVGVLRGFWVKVGGHWLLKDERSLSDTTTINGEETKTINGLAVSSSP